jgi:hypothetical protein
MLYAFMTMLIAKQKGPEIRTGLMRDSMDVRIDRIMLEKT